FGGHPKADDKRVCSLRPRPVARSGRSAQTGAIGSDRAARHGQSVRLGRFHADRRRWREDSHRRHRNEYTHSGNWGMTMTHGQALGLSALAALLLTGTAARAENLIVVEARGIGIKPGSSLDSTKPLMLKQGQHVTLISDRK